MPASQKSMEVHEMWIKAATLQWIQVEEFMSEEYYCNDHDGLP